MDSTERGQLDRTLSTPEERFHDSADSIEQVRESLPHRSLTTEPRSFGRSRSPRPPQDPLGLRVVHSPKESRRLDIVFVDGLGGTSRLSWSKDKDLEKFWPSEFLPLESEICHGRILTFGYDANIVRDVSNKASSVLDFAKDLLFELKYAKDENAEELGFGAV